MTGPLKGIKVVEFAGLGPAPFCAMVLADMGAEVLRVARPGAAPGRFDVNCRNRATVNIDLRAPGAADALMPVIAGADALIEGFRPGVMERLGFGPEPCLAANPRLVYGRMTGWGQSGPLKAAAGHDINYIAISGALHAVGPAGDKPVPPLNLVGDYGAGAMLLGMGLLAALLESRSSGRGQVVDAAMTDGAALLCTNMFAGYAAGKVSSERGANLVDGGAPFYDTYACADGRFIAIGAIEPQFYSLLLERCGVADPLFEGQMDRARWPMMKLRLADVFRTRTRDEWCALLEGTDVCFAPVLDWGEAPHHAHNVQRGTFVEVEGVVQPAPAPRFSRTSPATPVAGRTATPQELLERWGLDPSALIPLRPEAANA
jgi:alpha-methylacyl-CoA racemase